MENSYYPAPGLDASQERPPRRILVIQPYRYGDVLQMTPIVRGMVERWPGVQIDFLVGHRCAGLIRENRDIHRTIEIEEDWLLEERWGAPGEAKEVPEELKSLLTRLRGLNYDLVLNRFTTRPGAHIASAVGAGQCLGFQRDSQGRLVAGDEASLYFLGAAADLRFNPFNLVDLGCAMAGVIPSTPGIQFSAEVSAAKEVRGFLASTGLEKNGFLVVQIGASRKEKQWDRAAMASFITRLSAVRPVVLVGSKEEAHFLGEFCSLTGNGTILAWPGLSWSALKALLEQAALFVTTDTGPMHLAASCRVPLLVLFLSRASPFEAAPYRDGAWMVSVSSGCSRNGVRTLHPDFLCRLAEFLLGLSPRLEVRPGDAALYRSFWEDGRLRLLPAREMLADSNWEFRTFAEAYWQPRLFPRASACMPSESARNEYRMLLVDFAALCDHGLRAIQAGEREEFIHHLSQAPHGLGFLAHPLSARLRFNLEGPREEEGFFRRILHRERRYVLEALRGLR